MRDLTDKVALVTGASRGIGAAVAGELAERGADVVVNFHTKGPRAEAVAASIRQQGRRAWLAQADLTSDAERRAMLGTILAQVAHLDLVVLNASGGLERDKPANYAMDLNYTAQLELVTLAVPHMRAGGRIVFVTSHLAHFYRQKPVYAAYEPVAASKYAGEQALRARIPALLANGIQFVVVSGDLIEGTITPKLMERADRGLIATRRQQAGALPTVEGFAHAIVEACADPDLHSGATIFVGSTEW